MIYRNLIDTLVFSNGKQHETVIEDVPFLRMIQFEFPNGVLTAAGGAADATLQEDGLLRALLKKIELKVDGTDTPIDTDGIGEYWRRAIMTGSAGVLKSTMPVGAASTPQRVSVTLDFDQLVSAARHAGRIDVVNLDTLKLRVKNGVVETDMVTGGDRTETMTGDIEVIGVYDTNPANYQGGGRRIAYQKRETIAATTDGRIIIPSGLLVPQILFVAVDDSARDNDIVRSIKVKVGENDVQREISWEALQSLNVEDYGLELSSGLPPYAGVAILDFDEDRDMRPDKILNTEGLKSQSAKVILTLGAPTGVSYVDAYIQGIDRRGLGNAGSVQRRRAKMAARVAAGRRR